MATAAPVAPSAQSESTGSQSTEGQQTKSTPSLPGVAPDSTGDAEIPVVSRYRDAHGRFAKTEGQAPPAPDAVVEPPAPTKYQFEGEEYDSEDAFKQNYRSMRGSFKAAQRAAQEAKAALAEAHKVGWGWHEAYQRIQAERSASPKPAEPVTTPDQAQEKGIDWELYADIQRIANETGEPWKAQQWLQQETDRINSERVQKLLAEKLGPYEQAREREATKAKVGEVFGYVADLVYNDDTPAFPELHNDEQAYEVGKLWSEMGQKYQLPPTFLQSHEGAMLAIAFYRLLRDAQGRQPAAPQVAAASSAPPPVPAEIIAGQAASIGDGRPEKTTAAPSTEAERLIDAMRKTSLNRAHFGFAE